MPAWRIAPPNILRNLKTRAMVARSPATAGPGQGLDLVGVVEAALAGGGADHHAGERRGRPRLVVDDVAVGVRDDLIPRLALGPDGRLVGHGPAGHEAGGFFAHNLGDPLLE